MGKKQKSKARLDKFYHIAKSTGYRSRAAFKLIQINKKYNFLQNCNNLVDLCAAPGGWLQVAEQFMPMKSVKIGVDLDKIKPIPNVKTYQCDITTQQCLQLIKKDLKNQKADVVLHDGAPNVGANWNKDAYMQNELVLASLKLATQILKKGGTFVTKVFRSNDYNSLIWVFNKLFEKVEATKPEASRTQSAEIFVVCLNYIAPEYIDKQFFDPKVVFKDTEADIQEQATHTDQVTSLKQLLKQKKNREGYMDNVPQHLFKKCTFSQFVTTKNPYNLLYENVEMIMDEKAKEEFLPLVQPPQDYETLFQDLKVLGATEFQALLKWRNKINDKLYALKKKAEKLEEKQKQEGEEEEEIDSDEELEQEIEKENKNTLHHLKKEKEKKLQLMAKQKALSDKALLTTTIEQDEELFDITKHQNLLDLEYVDVEEEEKKELQKEIDKFEKKGKYQVKNEKKLQENIDHIQSLKKLKQEKEKQAKKEKSKVNDSVNVDDQRFQCDQIDNDNNQEEENDVNKNQNDQMEIEQEEVDPELMDQQMQRRWFDKDIFSELKKEIKNEVELKYNQQQAKSKQENGVQKQKKQKKQKNIEIEEEEQETKPNKKEKKKQKQQVNLEQNKKNKKNDEERTKQLKKLKMEEKLKAFDNDQDSDIDYNKEDIQENDESENQEQKLKKNKKKMKQQEKFQLAEDIEEGNYLDDAIQPDEGQEKPTQNGIYDSEIYINRSKGEKTYAQLAAERKKQKKQQKQQNDYDPDQDEYADLDQSDVDSEDRFKITVKQSDMEKRRKQLKRQQKKKEKAESKNTEKPEEIEIVAQKQFEDYDIDDLAGTLALAKKMLRKKDSEQIIDSTYNKYNFPEDEVLPEWFVSDEQKHNFVNLPISKEEYQSEKDRLMAINTKTPKKIQEAKWRKYRKIKKAQEKAKSKAEQIYEEEGVSEANKLKRMQSVYKKEMLKQKKEKRYVVAKKGGANGPAKSNKSVAYVDKRLKKDKRAQKMSNSSKRIKKGGGTKTRQKNRRHGKKNRKF